MMESRPDVISLGGIVFYPPDSLKERRTVCVWTPVIVTLVVVVTSFVWITNVAVVLPGWIYTLEGTVADAELDDKATVMPVAGAGPFRVTVVVIDDPPTNVVGPK